jgi:hypothetical protein
MAELLSLWLARAKQVCLSNKKILLVVTEATYIKYLSMRKELVVLFFTLHC